MAYLVALLIKSRIEMEKQNKFFLFYTTLALKKNMLYV